MDEKVNISRDWIKDLIRDFIAISEPDNMQNEVGDPAWADALVGFASGAGSNLAAL